MESNPEKVKMFFKLNEVVEDFRKLGDLSIHKDSNGLTGAFVIPTLLREKRQAVMDYFNLYPGDIINLVEGKIVIDD